MKKLLLIRHAKATHENGYPDFERPLKEAGKEDAILMSSILKGQSIIPQIMVTSPALRTQTTADIFTAQLQLPEAGTDKRIYEANEYTLVKVVKELSDEYNFVGIVGHNPSISQVLYYFTGQYRDLPTCAVALLTFDNDTWQSISTEEAHLTFFDSPKG